MSRLDEAALSLLGQEPVAAYLYDLVALREHCARVRAALPAGVEMFYAIKANAEVPNLRTMQPYLDGFEVASGGELDHLRAHFPNVPILFGGPGKTPAELRRAAEHQIHVESLWELRQLAELHRPVRLLLRMNPALDHREDSPMLMAGKPSPFGITPDHLPQAVEILRQHPNLEFLGFHLHTRSLQLDLEEHLRLLQRYMELAEHWSQDFRLHLQVLNVGGGIGVNYRQPSQQFDWEQLCRRLPGRPYTLRFECGRFLTAFCGTYACEVLDLKESHGQYFAICRGGTHHFRLPAAQGHSHPFRVLAGPRRGPVLEKVLLNVVGQLCTPKDRLASAAPVQQVGVGDLLLFPLAGAYAWNISHHDFLMHPHPRQIFVDA
ncbi:MAG: type III PLP-dependent enzyme [Candidatus Eremiobacteraeota bacterium]|nr:type III PLP-dependent enzyme [Candidatus Eremiobacteraeota bacterium]MCW5871956.1 type III PLP-dependent enzyme [Candidatus Eremiobacteraeota bacterium]